MNPCSDLYRVILSDSRKDDVLFEVAKDSDWEAEG